MTRRPPPGPLEPLPAIDHYLDLAMERSEFLQQGQAYLADLSLWLRNNANLGRDGRVLPAFSQGHDVLFDVAYRYAVEQWRAKHGQDPPRVCLAAVGGYGNRALCLRSDIDLLVLMEKHAPPTETFVKALLLVLIDFKWNLSYVTRTVADCENKVGSDLESVTSMSSGRLIAGHETLFGEFRGRLQEAVRGRGRRWYLRSLFEEWKARRLKFESTVYLLQPNLKEGQGGLRDADTVRWILFGLTGSTDLEQLREQAGFEEDALREYCRAIGMIQTVRSELHLLSNTAGDLLLFEFMPEIARRLEYEPDALRSAEELFMADYYGYARSVDRLSMRAVKQLLRSEKSILGELVGSLRRRRLDKDIIVQDEVMYVDPKSVDYFESDPTRILAMFHRAARWGYRLSDRTLDNLSRLAGGLGVGFRLDPANHRHLLGILKQNSNVAATLADMHECRILERFMPEFERVRCMVRIDHYHHYTVDEHTLKTLEMAERLRNQPPTQTTAAGKVARQIQRWDLLNMALLLHDVGKGYGRGHALRGGQIAQRVGERMKLPPADIDLVRFLVLSHLKLNHASQRRDITDPEVARQLADEIGGLERLKMLYVLTVCDLMAVSPDAWSDWKAQLLAECYLRTADLIGGKDPARAMDSPDRQAIRERVLRALLEELGRAHPPAAERAALAKDLDDFLREVSDYYLKTIDPEVIARHCRLRRELDEDNLLAWQLDQEPAPTPARDSRSTPAHTAFSRLTVFAADVPGLFCYICGALAAKGVNIWSAQIFSTNDGFAINQFQVTDLENRPLSEGLRLDRLRNDLNQVIKGHLPIDDLIARHRTRQPRRARPRAVHPASVVFDNKSSRGYTIIEIRTADRPGLLFRITRALSECLLDIHRSIIATEAYGVVDVFYVTDMEYNKIHGEPDQQKIRGALLAAIGED